MYRADQDIQQDRLTALKRGGAAAVAALFHRVPSLAEYVQDVGPLVNPWDRTTDNWTLRRLVVYLASSSGTQLLISHADRIQYQLLGLALWHGGTADRDQAITESGIDPLRLDEAVDGLGELLLVDRDRGWLVPCPGVLDDITPPGPMIRFGLEQVVSRDIATILTNLGVDGANRKAERVIALETAVRDVKVLLPVLASLDENARTVFDALVTTGQLDLNDLYDDDPLDYGARYGRYRDRQEALTTLQSYGLIGVDRYNEAAWVWYDVMVTLSGGLFDSWEPVDLATVDSVSQHFAAGVPDAVGHLDRILGYVRTNPMPALQSGGVGVKAVRAVGKGLDLPGPTVGLLVALGIELGLIGQTRLGATGRGRNRRHTIEWRPTEAADEWRAVAPTERWRLLVEVWLSSHYLTLDGKPIERSELTRPAVGHALITGLLIRELGDIAPGEGVGRAALGQWLAFRYPSFVTEDAGVQLVAQAVLLGVVHDSDPVAPTALTRHLLAGDDLSEVVEDGANLFVVQADHTLIAPPDLNAEVALQLGLVASLESQSGARVYRIDDRSLLSAFDAGLDADEVVGFLAAHSSVDVPSVVDRTIRDAFARYGRLRVGSTTTWVACDDPAALAQALAVKAAKLMAVSPTAAVSPHPRSKVMGALRAAGVAALDVTATDDDKRTVDVRPSPTARSARRGPDLTADIVELAEQLINGQVVSRAPPGPGNHADALAYELAGVYDEEGW